MAQAYLLAYKLYFSIPEQKSVPVNGEITIEFNLDAPQEIILDFREKPEKIKSVSVNGQTARYEFHNEHIILPEKNIVEGKNNITPAVKCIRCIGHCRSGTWAAALRSGQGSGSSPPGSRNAAYNSEIGRAHV